MIFVTVGTQLPFDRLLKGVEGWASKQPDQRIVAQTGRTNEKYSRMECFISVSPSQYDQYVQQSQLIIAHAGIGSLFTAMRYRKPIVIVPRKAELGEHRNDHQIATAERFSKHKGIYVAEDETCLDHVLGEVQQMESPPVISPYASDELLMKLTLFINGRDHDVTSKAFIPAK